MTAILSIECNEPEGKIVRSIYPLVFTPENLAKFWDKAKQYPTLYGNEISNAQDFYNLFINQGENGLSLNGLFWVIDDFVGVVYLNNITSQEADIHYSFFDKRHKGREVLAKKMLKYIFNTYGFHRLNVQILSNPLPLSLSTYLFGQIQYGPQQIACHFY